MPARTLKYNKWCSLLFFYKLKWITSKALVEKYTKQLAIVSAQGVIAIMIAMS